MNDNRMLVAVRSGFAESEDGGLEEITAGRSRIAPEVLEREPALNDFFDPNVSLPGWGGGVRETRSTLPDGRVLADRF